MDDKSQLLDEISPLISTKDNFGIRYLISTFLLMAMVLMTFFPKVYLQTQIYYKSRDISTLNREYKLLKEENKLLARKVERIKFKNQVLDTLF